MDEPMTATPVTYSAIARREEAGWDVEVAEADRSHTWAPNLRKARLYARQVAASWFDLDLDAVEVDLIVDGAATEIAALRVRRQAAQQAAAEAAEATRAAVQRLSGMGLSDRDVADVIGLSVQRVQQLRTTGVMSG